ncbi:MAG: DEAD/DEAH box helicase, partial [Streptococcaceae bacterium]|nr:DEAD/DEAH box helicase [Streptococcaceae bacterium]
GGIIQTYATDLNPGKQITPIIEELTGINNKRVKKAPYFEDVADTLYALLQDTVFVAHNIHFDFHFLNSEFKRAGLASMSNYGVDTVELAQIFLPTQSSYKLNELAKALDLVHENPHQADSDAFVTAGLLLKIEELIQQIPIQTLKQIVALADVLTMDNKLFLENRLNKRLLKSAEKLPKHLHTVDGLVLCKPNEKTIKANVAKKYPKYKKQKQQIFGELLEYREEQARYMNMVYNHFSSIDTSKNLFVEASTGIGKTLGYLLPLAYLATKEEKAIIATPSILLQNQLMQKDLPIIEKLLPDSFQATLVKSPKHYLDLTRFKSSLIRGLKQKQYRMYQMSVLVWLTNTQTGDFEELNYLSLNHSFFEQVQHRGMKYLDPFSPFYTVDFLKRVNDQMEESNILIVNHAYLAQENNRVAFSLPKSKYLLIDEVHHLPNTLTNVTREKVELNSFTRRMKYFAEEENYEELFKLLSNQTLNQRLHLFRMLAYETSEQLVQFISKIHRFIPSGTQMEDIYIDEQMIQSMNIRPLFTRIKKNIRQLIELSKNMEQEVLATQAHYSSFEKFYLQNYFDFGNALEKALATFEVFINEWSQNYVKWLFINPRYQTLNLSVQDFDKNLIESAKWYERFEKIVYTSGTLKIGNNHKYLPLSLGVKDYEMKRIPLSFDYKNQAKIFIAQDFGIIGDEEIDEMAKKIAQTVIQFSEKIDESMLFLFTSHELLAKTREIVRIKLEETGRLLLAHNFNGNRSKILKTFQTNKGAILFGADSFWEGIDLAGDTLKIIVVTRLPFENPQRIMTKKYYEYLESKEISPFDSVNLPKAGLRLRQGLGRLIRSKDDKGVMLILDQRISTKNYGKRLLNVFPKDIEIKPMNSHNIVEQIKEFLL